MSKRYFEFNQGTSDKFWEIEFSELSFKVRWGRCGTAGQSKEKSFESEAETVKKGEQLIKEKLKEGYLEITAGNSGSEQQDSEASTKVSAPKAVNKAKTAPESSNLSQAASAKSESSKVSAVAEPSSEEVKPSVSKDTEILPCERTLGLTDKELRWAPWRNIPPLPKQEPQPFDKEDALKRLKALKLGSYGWDPNWSGVKLPLYMSRIEAHFWVEAMANIFRSTEPDAVQKLVNRMEGFQPTGDFSFETAISLFNGKQSLVISPDVVLPLFYLLEIEELCEFIMTIKCNPTVNGNVNKLMVEKFRLVLPYITTEQLERCRTLLRPKLDKKEWPDSFSVVDEEFLLAAFIGMHEELLEVVESWPDDLCNIKYNTWQQQQVIFALRDPSLINLHIRRLKVIPYEPEHIKAWLASTEFSNLDIIVSAINMETNKGVAESMVKAFSCAKSPETAVAMLEIYLGSKASRLAKEWIERNKYTAIEGFATIAGGSGKITEAALDMLRMFQTQGLGDIIAKVSESLPEATRERIRIEVLGNEALSVPLLDEVTTPKRISSLLSEYPSKAKRPLWLNIEELPPILVNKCRFTTEQTTRVLLYLIAPSEKTLELVDEIKKEGDPIFFENFGWKLFELWLGAGAPSKEKWAFEALGYTGGDRTALKLSPMIRVWPGEAQHKRAVAGLDILRVIGTDTALMQLNGIAQKVPFKALKERANECMDEIARDKGLTKAELEDRIVPDCGLDEKGRFEFDFGTRKFTFALSSDMKPMVRDEDGKLRDDLPKPNSKDDQEKAAASVATWKLLKKQIREVAKIQAGRLEQAMIIGRRWTREQFELLLVRHPLMVHLARMLVWAGYTKEGAFIKTFRVNEEGSYADESDSAVNLEECDRIGIIHPLNLTHESAATWGELFSDYEILPPFPQLGRAVYTLDDAELKCDTITRFDGMEFPAPTLVFTLEKFGWERGTAMDGGCFEEHSKQFPAAGVTIVLTYNGYVGMGWIDPSEQLEITNIYFVNGLREPTCYAGKEDKLALEKVDKVVISEVLHDLSSLAAKAI